MVAQNYTKDGSTVALAAQPAPRTLDEKIIELKKQLEAFIANANQQAARLAGKIEAYEELKKESEKDAD